MTNHKLIGYCHDLACFRLLDMSLINRDQREHNAFTQIVGLSGIWLVL